MSLRQMLSRALQQPDDNDENALMRLETDLPAVQLSTIHASKRLGVPHCVLPLYLAGTTGETDLSGGPQRRWPPARPRWRIL